MSNEISPPDGADLDGAAWLELESDPGVFQDILRKLGAIGVKVQELYGLDDDYFSMLTGQVLGLIFLFNYRQVDGEEEEGVQACPDHVWFANQTTNNSCATVAMLNILLNVPGIKLNAEILTELKACTSDLRPVERGECLSEMVNIRRIHNESARKMDALNASLVIQNEYDEWKKASRYRKKSISNKRKRSNGSKAKTSNQAVGDAFHYIAYVPIGDEVWRLDGLLKEPRCLGKYQDDWTAHARENMLQRISEEEDLVYNLMALCASEEQTLLLQILRNAVSIDHLRQATAPDDITRYIASTAPQPLQDEEIVKIFGITHQQLKENAGLGVEILMRMEKEDHMTILRQLIGEQLQMKTTYLKHKNYDQQENFEPAMQDHDMTDDTFEIIKVLVDGGAISTDKTS